MSEPTIAPRQRVEQPGTVPWRFGLYSVAAVLPQEGAHWQFGVEYEDDDAAFAPGTILGGPCLDAAARTKSDAPFPGWGTLAADPFTLYAGVECKLPFESFTVAERRARRRFERNEPAAIEERLWAMLSAEAVTLTPHAGTPVSLVHGVAHLEELAATLSTSLGVIHAPRVVAPYMAAQELVGRDGAIHRTHLDTPVAFGVGYDPAVGPAGQTPGTPDDGTAWLYATGPIVVRRSDIFVPGDEASWLNRATDDVRVMAERTFVVTVGQYVAAVRVDLTLCACAPAAPAALTAAPTSSEPTGESVPTGPEEPTGNQPEPSAEPPAETTEKTPAKARTGQPKKAESKKAEPTTAAPNTAARKRPAAKRQSSKSTTKRRASGGSAE